MGNSIFYFQINTCIMCRAKAVATGSKEDIEQLRGWSKKGKAWAMAMLAQRYSEGVGVKQSDKKAIEFYEMAAKRGEATVAKFKPSTDMEQQINNLLNTSGMNESSLTETEDRQLALNELTEDEVSMTIHTYIFSFFLVFFVFFVDFKVFNLRSIL